MHENKRVLRWKQITQYKLEDQNLFPLTRTKEEIIPTNGFCPQADDRANVKEGETLK